MNSRTDWLKSFDASACGRGHTAHAVAGHRHSCTGYPARISSRACGRTAILFGHCPRTVETGRNVMSPMQLIGDQASALVFATFTMKAMLPLRLIAIASSVMFLAFSRLADATPIILLHTELLPLNAGRLRQTPRLQDGIADGADRAEQGAGPSTRFLRRMRLPAPCVADACRGPLI
jgi:hypothetical protein